ncbi:hypothetical protein [Prosthecobacter sp. SYSU 5D2]|uniref:hypothetical protein n=1 Tax=Prosthecobacter sp. SYSU 5D2 TaxID=3134134 RepID=UPI0031FF1D48
MSSTPETGPNRMAHAHRRFFIVLCLASAIGFVLLNRLGNYLLEPSTKVEIHKNAYKTEYLRPYLEAEEWILYSLDPYPWRRNEGEDLFNKPPPLPGSEEAQKTKSNTEPPGEPKRKVPPDQEFHNFPILGKLVMQENEKLRYVIQALDTAGQNWMGAVAGCFSPRHGIRVMREGTIHDLVICYQCSSAVLYVNGKHVGGIYFATTLELDPSPDVLDGILRKAGIKRTPVH